MNFNPSRFLFMCMLMMGTVISISASSWMSAWIGLEINLLSFIPIMINNSNQFSTEAALKYFLTQAMASIILLSFIVAFLMLSNWYFSLKEINLLISATLLLKMGAAPFHFWFPGVMEGLNWVNGFVLMTWQKVAPLMLISYVWNINLFTTIIILTSIFVGSLGGLNQTSLRKIMAYSSINHLGWMLSSFFLGEIYWIFYFSFYSFLNLSVILIFHLNNLSHVKQIFSFMNKSNILNWMLFCNLLSMGGLPPFLGFLPKWVIIQGLTGLGMYYLVIMMVIMTLITLYYYLRMGYAAFLLTHNELKWWINPEYSPSWFIYLFSFISISGLLLSNFIVPII